MIVSLSLACLVGLAASLLSDHLVRPRVTGLRRRPAATLGVHVGTWLIFFTIMGLLTQRPWLTAGVLLVLQVVVVHSNNAKWISLNEPFVVHDFEYFVDAIRYPRLYVPFFGIGLAIGATLVSTAAITLFLVYEPAVLMNGQAVSALIALGGLGLLGVGTLAVGLPRLATPRLEPIADLTDYGLVAHFWAYGLRLRHRPDLVNAVSAFRDYAAPHNDGPLPDIVCVQSESFFDPRRWTEQAADSLLPEWDHACAESQAHGTLDVPAWGANTVRTESAVLTGIDAQTLDIDHFNPYRRLAHITVPSLVGALRELGYETIAIHPYPASFYARDRVLRRMGCDRFIDIDGFTKCDYDGQFISDEAVGRCIRDVLAEPGNRPRFVFAITMENHGPTDLEWADLNQSAFRETLTNPDALPAEHEELPIYLRHIANADRMLGQCRQALEANDRPGLLAWYGDHVPILANTYRDLGQPDGRTDYAIWTTDRTRHNDAVAEQPMQANALGVAILNQAVAMTRGIETETQQPGGAHVDAGPKERGKA